MERTITNSLVPFQSFQPGRNKLRHASPWVGGSLSGCHSCTTYCCTAVVLLYCSCTGLWVGRSCRSCRVLLSWGCCRVSTRVRGFFFFFFSRYVYRPRAGICPICGAQNAEQKTDARKAPPGYQPECGRQFCRMMWCVRQRNISSPIRLHVHAYPCTLTCV